MPALRRSYVFALFLLFACASKQQLPPGDALEAEELSAAAPAPKMLPPPPPPDAEERAFAEQLNAKEEASKAVAVTPNVEAKPVEDDSAAAKARATAALSSAKSHLAARELDAADAELKAAEGDAKSAGPEVDRELYELRYRLAAARKDDRAQTKAALGWLVRCGPAAVESCRKRALDALSAVSAQRRDAADLREADGCVKRSEGHPSAMPACLEQASALYRRLSDRLMLARIAAAKGELELSKKPSVELAQRLVEAVDRACSELRCAAVRRAAFRHAYSQCTRANDVEAAAKYALLDAFVFSQTQAPEQRPWARTREADVACAAYDAKNGPDACRKLEKQLTGGYTFKDFSRMMAPGEGLSGDSVKEVNAHYGVTLERCLSEHAARLVPPASEREPVRWTVSNDGRVTHVELDRKDPESGPLAQCLREQFSLWRYPRYRGELQHIEQVFVINARQRR